MVADCPKFIPNIFNNTKCSSCFKTREEHGDVALDLKSLRKVVKCGYLFVAPRDWDFCNPAVYRAKRWQRRWFVLWSDDQLTWSIDDQPDTIPQGTLEMREILEVKSAEEITENPYSLALTGKQATFIKGMNNEDIKSWQSVLSKYGNRLITTGSGKRSLTLPGGFGSSNNTRFETGVVIGPSRPRFHSVTNPGPVGNLLSSPTSPYGKSSYPDDNDHDHDDSEHVFISASTPKIISTLGAVTPKVSSTNSSFYGSSNVSDNELPSPSPPSPGGNGNGNKASFSSTTSTTTSNIRSFYVALSNVPTGKFRSFQSSTTLSSSTNPSSRLLSSTILPPSSPSTSQPASSPTEEEIPTRSTPPQEFESTDTPDCRCPTTSVRALRGDPDGCGGLDNLDGGPLRKGWLLRQTNNDWTKHWFVLQNNSLLYYENSEELNPLGNIEITDQTIIRQFESNRHYGFEVTNKSVVSKLSAITNGMRGIWMKALEAAKSNKSRGDEGSLIQEPSSPPHPHVANPPSPPLKSKKSRWRKKTDLKLFESLKDEFSERERELESLRTELRVDSPRMRELLKSQALQIDNFRTQISSGFMEIEKLELYCKSRESEYSESLKCKDEIIEEIREQLSQEVNVRESLLEQSRRLETQLSLVSTQVIELKRILRETEQEADMENIRCKEIEVLMQARNLQISHETDLLKIRCNDLTEKLYQSEKSAKSLKTKLGRVKSQSLKDRQIESDVLNKITDLEEKLSKLDASPTSPQGSSGPCSGVSITSPVPPSPSGGSGSGGSQGIVNVIMKLNDLDQRVDKAMDSYWFRRGELEEFVGGNCQNCKLLELELQEREDRLEVLEENLMHLETDFNNKVKELKEFVKEQPSSAEASQAATQVVNKYQAEIEQLRSLCSKGLEAMENSHRRMVAELEEKHRREIQSLKIEKESELAEETKATLSALDAMRKNHQVELQKEIVKFKEEFMKKFSSSQDLSDMHREHEQELREVKEEILRLSEKYSLKCVEASKLEETISYLKTQLNEAKRRILDMEGSDFQSIISCASSGSKEPTTIPKPKPRTGKQAPIAPIPLPKNRGLP